MPSVAYWKVCPELQDVLFKANRPGYVDLAVEKAAIKSTIYDHPEFTSFYHGHEHPLCRLARQERKDAEGPTDRAVIPRMSLSTCPKIC